MINIIYRKVKGSTYGLKSNRMTKMIKKKIWLSQYKKLENFKHQKPTVKCSTKTAKIVKKSWTKRGKDNMSSNSK